MNDDLLGLLVLIAVATAIIITVFLLHREHKRDDQKR